MSLGRFKLRELFQRSYTFRGERLHLHTRQRHPRAEHRTSAAHTGAERRIHQPDANRPTIEHGPVVPILGIR